MLAPNSLLKDRYLILHRVGGGGFGEVYKAIDQVFGCAVAIKETKEQVSGHEQLRKAFEREAKLLRNLSHECLPRVSDYFFVERAQYLVMDYIEGEDLFARLKKRMDREGPFTVAELLPWADKILSALEYLHTRTDPIIHRDIKPSNITLTETGKIYLLDFGLAKGFTGQMSTLLEGQSLLSLAAFTHEYAPLEQIQGTGTEAQSDIYAFGATLYHLLTGQTPISASKRDELMHREHRDHLPMAHEVNPAIPKAISEVISKAMAIRWWERLASAKEMRSLLSESGSQTEKPDPVNSRHKSIRPSPMPFPDERRPSAESMHMIPAKVAAKIGSSARRGVVAGGLLVLVTALAIGALFRFPQWFTKSEIQKPPTEASPSPVQNKAGVPMTPRHLKPILLRPAHRGTIWSVAYSPDGKYVASAGNDKKILLWKADNWDELGKELAGHTGPVYSVAFSPDGKTLASASEDGSIRLWDTSTRLSTPLVIDEKQWPILRVTFSPNGEYLASCASRDVKRGCEELRIWEMRDRTPRNVNGNFSEVHAIAFSPDSSVLATVGLDRQMHLWDVSTGGEKGTQSFDEMLTSVSFFRENGLMACGASDGTIRFWRYDLPHIDPGKPLQAARDKPEKAVNVVVAASPDNKTLASVVPGEEIRLWDIQSRDFTSLSGQKIKWELWSLLFHRTARN